MGRWQKGGTGVTVNKCKLSDMGPEAPCCLYYIMHMIVYVCVNTCEEYIYIVNVRFRLNIYQ